MEVRNKFNPNVIAYIIGIIGVLIPIVYSSYINNSNIILYINSYTPIIDNNNVDSLRIYYGDKEIVDLYQCSFYLENTGNKPILESDIYKPIMITLKGGGTILDILNNPNNNIDISLKSININAIEINFDLLNKDDRIYFSLLTTEKPDSVICNSRIKNVKSIKIKDDRDTSKKENNKFLEILLKGGIGFLIFIYTVYLTGFKKRKKVMSSMLHFEPLPSENWKVIDYKKFIKLSILSNYNNEKLSKIISEYNDDDYPGHNAYEYARESLDSAKNSVLEEYEYMIGISTTIIILMIASYIFLR